jgi:hypothetical protein
MLRLFLYLGLLGLLGYVQNMAFTWSSRSRNSGDPNYHRYASWCSNGVGFIMTVTIWGTIWKSLTTGDWPALIATGVVYTLFTSEGSVAMMKLLLKREKGKQKVGASNGAS